MMTSGQSRHGVVSSGRLLPDVCRPGKRLFADLVDAAALALVCSCVLAVLLWKGCASEWYVFCSAVLPLRRRLPSGRWLECGYFISAISFCASGLADGSGFGRLCASRFCWAGLLRLFCCSPASRPLTLASRPTPTLPSTAASVPPPRIWRQTGNAANRLLFSMHAFYFPLQYYLRDPDCRLFVGRGCAIPRRAGAYSRRWLYNGRSASYFAAVASGSFIRPTAVRIACISTPSSGCIEATKTSRKRSLSKARSSSSNTMCRVVDATALRKTGGKNMKSFTDYLTLNIPSKMAFQNITLRDEGK